MRYAEGDTLAGRYRVQQHLGQGGMGFVLRAEDLQLHRDVALKLLLPERLEDKRVVDRFVREARAVAALENEHTVRLFHTDTLQDGAPFIVMELLRGEDLRSRLDRERKLPLEQTVVLLLQACQALAEAHRRGIVHRDLKPANLFVDERVGRPVLKVLDFGIAKVGAEVNRSTVETTAEGKVLGTPLYMSPEQRDGADIDERADIWSLGVLLYELTTGELPFPSENLWQLEYAVRTKPPRPLPPELDGRVGKIVERCLAKEPAQRYPDVAALAAALAPLGPSAAQASARRVQELRHAPAAPSPSSGAAVGVDPDSRASGASIQLPRRWSARGIGLFLSLLVCAGLALLWGRSGSFDVVAELKLKHTQTCPSLPSTAKLVVEAQGTLHKAFVDASCKVRLRDLPGRLRGAPVRLELQGVDDLVLASAGAVTLQPALAVWLDFPKQAPLAEPALEAEPAPKAVAPEPAAQSVVVRLRPPGGGRCPRALRGGRLQVGDSVLPIAEDCSVRLESTPGRAQRFSLESRCFELVGPASRIVNGDSLTLSLARDSACRPRKGPRCEQPCRCWDERNNPCKCLYPCADDCAATESLCAP